MTKYVVEIHEALSKVVTIEAESEEDALEIAEQQWKNSEIELYPENFDGVEFFVIGKCTEKENE